MQDSKKGFFPFRVGSSLSVNQRPKTPAEIERMRGIPYASAVGSLMYAMLCTRPDICFAVGMVSRYQSDPGEEHWIAVKHIFKYLRRTIDYMLVYRDESLVPKGTLTQISCRIGSPGSLPLDMCSPLGVEPSVGRV